MKIKIEPVKPTDLKQLIEISRNTFKATFLRANNKQNLEKYLKKQLSTVQLAMELDNLNSKFYFVKLGVKIVGYLKLNMAGAQTEATYPQALEIQRIYILPEYQRMGIGNQLLMFTIQRAKRLSKKLIWLGVWEQNVKAQRFYSKAGFVRTAEHSFRIGDEVQTDWIMIKKLEES